MEPRVHYCFEVCLINKTLFWNFSNGLMLTLANPKVSIPMFVLSCLVLYSGKSRC